MTQYNHVHWKNEIADSYVRYLRSSFYFRDRDLRESFGRALAAEDELVKGPFPEVVRSFVSGCSPLDLAQQYFGADAGDIEPALREVETLYAHQQRAVDAVHGDDRNLIVATGTGSGKTECFVYPILFHLYQQFLDGVLSEPGVRAMVIYPMNALANDQRERLGSFGKALEDSGAHFSFTFGQYTGQTPNSESDSWRHAADKAAERLPGELVFRDEMRRNPPHILLTNYSMLEYLLLRPNDSPLFDNGLGEQWRFIVLDEAHMHRGAQGAEIGMLIRRLKQRIRAGGRINGFTCIGTSATISSTRTDDDRAEVADFASGLFGEPFESDDIVFGNMAPTDETEPRRNHIFIRGLEGAFLIHENCVDVVALNRRKGDDGRAEPIEIALCRECGQHYYIGREKEGRLSEAIRSPLSPDFGVDYYMPLVPGVEATHILCRRCASLWRADATSTCGCDASIAVAHCEPHKEHADQVKKCENCGYTRGGLTDPVQEIIHGGDGPGAVIATTLNRLLPEKRRKVLAFADSRQEAAFFAWFAEDTYRSVSNRIDILSALRAHPIEDGGLSVEDLAYRLVSQSEISGPSETQEQRRRDTAAAAWNEVLTDERRISLTGVGLARWFVHLPKGLLLPSTMFEEPWSFTRDEARTILGYLLELMMIRNAMELPSGVAGLDWSSLSDRPQTAYKVGGGGGRNVSQWGHTLSSAVGYLCALRGLYDGFDDERSEAQELMESIWYAVRDWDAGVRESERILLRVPDSNNAFRLNPAYVRVELPDSDSRWACDTCGRITLFNVRDVCPSLRCRGRLERIADARLRDNHYRVLYESDYFPTGYRSEEHTAQIATQHARDLQDAFKHGQINLLSSSTTFEVGVDLGDLDATFLRNIPPETFNYAQRVGRVGRRDRTGFAVTYCRRNPHDLYHYEDPEDRVMRGVTRPPLLNIENRKIVLRHMASVVMGAFFRTRGNEARFRDVGELFDSSDVEDLSNEMLTFCDGNDMVEAALMEVVPDTLHPVVGLSDGSWRQGLFGAESRFYGAVSVLLNEIAELQAVQNDLIAQRKFRDADRIEGRIKSIYGDQSVNFLSRSVILPKYGFPVDVVELQTMGSGYDGTLVSLQRDLSQAIAEYAPGSEVVANKRVWRSEGMRLMPGQQPAVRYYRADDEGNFEHSVSKENLQGPGIRQYITPQWGFTTSSNYVAKLPTRKAERLYATRPYFGGFMDGTEPETKDFGGILVSVAAPGRLYILSEGNQRKQFYICLSCGRHEVKRKGRHKTLFGRDCGGRMGRYSYGYELATDVIRLLLPGLNDRGLAYSVAYAILLGAAETLGVPNTDLDLTLSAVPGNDIQGMYSIVLYDNVPGGAGLVARLSRPEVINRVLVESSRRVGGGCGCDVSCYGCLRSYRNQIFHDQLDRNLAQGLLNMIG